MRPGKEYENLYASAEARAAADWFAGINANREEEIQSFQPQNFYRIVATAGRLWLTWQDGKSKQTRTFHKEMKEAKGRSFCFSNKTKIKQESKYGKMCETKERYWNLSYYDARDKSPRDLF